MTKRHATAKESGTMVEYWIKGDDGEEYGPATLGELAEWVKEDRAGLGTQVRTAHNGVWMTWQSYPELMALLAPAPGEELFAGQPDLKLGSVLARLAAYLFDMLAICFVLMLIVVLFVPVAVQHDSEAWLKRMAEGGSLTPEQAWLMLVALVVYLAYFTYFHGRNGQTPGKKLFKLRVVDVHGLTISYRQAFLRAIGAFLSQQFLCIGHFFALVTAKRQAFHDLAARSYVVRYTGKS